MAWQLIYTSSPRLLEAGRTGFGTVARHRAVNGLLATTIERFSQFARLAGHDPKRVVCSHRMLTIGGGRFHTLSCVQDAGSDYTGRTNHIAHHLIVTAGEIPPLIAAGITPADVLLGMSWRTAWTSAPRFLDASEEVDLASIPPHPCRAWLQATGIADTARLPSSPAAQRGCYLIIPPDVDARVLLGESLHERPDEAWQISFTTSLEPTDTIADFRWIGISSKSPLRTVTDSSARPVFDLQFPASLPKPPLQRATDAAIDVGTAPAPAAMQQSKTSSAKDGLPAYHTAGARYDACEGTSSDEANPACENSGLSLVALVAWFSVIAGAVIFVHQIRQNRKHAEIARLEQQVDDTWKKYHLKLADTRTWLKQQAEEGADQDTAASLIAAHEECVRQIRRSLESASSDQRVTIPDRTRDDFSEMLAAHDAWMKSRASTELPAGWKPRRPDDVRAMLDRCARERTAWKRFVAFFTREPDVDQSDRQDLVRRVLDVLHANTRLDGTPEEWRQMLNELGESTAGRLQAVTTLPSQAFNPSAP